MDSVIDQKSNRLNEQNNNSARASRFFCTFLCCHCITTTWNGQILSLLENRNGKAIYSTTSVWIRARSPLFSSNQNSLYLSNKANWDNRETVQKKCEVYSSATFSWTSSLSDCKPGFYYRRTLNLRKYPSGHRTIDTVPGTIRRGTVRYIAWLRKNPSGHSTRDSNPKELSIGARKDKHHTRGTIRRGTWGR